MDTSFTDNAPSPCPAGSSSFLLDPGAAAITSAQHSRRSSGAHSHEMRSLSSSRCVPTVLDSVQRQRGVLLPVETPSTSPDENDMKKNETDSPTDSDPIDGDVVAMALALRRKEAKALDTSRRLSCRRHPVINCFVSPEMETQYIATIHHPQLGRIVQCVFALATIAFSFVRSGNNGRSPVSPHTVAVEATIVALCLLTTVLLSCDRVIDRLLSPSSAHRVFTNRGLIQDYIVAFIAALTGIHQVVAGHRTVTFATSTGDLVLDRHWSDVGLILMTFLCAPPRLCTALLSMVAIEIAHIYTVAVYAPTSNAMICGATIIPCALMVAFFIVWAFDTRGRAYFEHRNNVAGRINRLTATITAIDRFVRDQRLAVVSSAANHNLDRLPLGQRGVARLDGVAVLVVRMATLDDDLGGMLCSMRVLVDTFDRISRTFKLEVTAQRFGTCGDTLCCMLQGNSATPAPRVTQAACGFARFMLRIYPVALRTAWSTMASNTNSATTSAAAESLRIGIDAGEVVLDPYRSPPFVAGHTMRAATRLSELAPSHSALVSSAVHDQSASVYSMTSLHDTVLEGVRMKLHILGAPFGDRWVSKEAAVENACARAELYGTEVLPSWTIGGGGDGSQSPPAAASPVESPFSASPTCDPLTAAYLTAGAMSTTNGGAVSSDSIDKMRSLGSHTGAAAAGEADTIQTAADSNFHLEFRWSWFFGWYFVDADVEQEFRLSECRGRQRFLPAVVAILATLIALLWFLINGTSPLQPWVYVAWSFALIMSMTLLGAVRQPCVSVRRFVLLTLLQCSVGASLFVALYFVDDVRNPLKLYMLDLIAIMNIAKLLWLTSCVPTALVFVLDETILLLGAQYAAGVKHISLVGVVFYFSGTLLFLAVSTALRQRSRQMFASTTANKRALCILTNALMHRELLLLETLPRIVVRRVLRFASHAVASAVDAVSPLMVAHSSHGVEEPALPSLTPLVSTDVVCEVAVVLAVQVESFNPDDSLDTATMSALASIAPGSSFVGRRRGSMRPDAATEVLSALLATPPRPSGFESAAAECFWCHAGHTVLCIATPAAGRALQEAMMTLTAIAEDLHVTWAQRGDVKFVSGLGIGPLAGQLVGGTRRQFVFSGPAIASAISHLAVGYQHLLADPNDDEDALDVQAINDLDDHLQEHFELQIDMVPHDGLQDTPAGRTLEILPTPSNRAESSTDSGGATSRDS
jgi:class 3 adenylate cyclase